MPHACSVAHRAQAGPLAQVGLLAQPEPPAHAQRPGAALHGGVRHRASGAKTQLAAGAEAVDPEDAAAGAEDVEPEDEPVDDEVEDDPELTELLEEERLSVR